MNEWDDLPNAKHIDFVIGSLKQYPDEWASAYNVAWRAAWHTASAEASAEAKYTASAAARNAARDTANYVARGAVRDAAYDAARDAARDAAWGEAYDAAWGEAYNAACYAILSLVAYDDCEKYLDMSYNELLFMAKLTEIPATILLLPYAKAMELIKVKQNSTID
jgi:hypothetical protein